MNIVQLQSYAILYKINFYCVHMNTKMQYAALMACALLIIPAAAFAQASAGQHAARRAFPCEPRRHQRALGLRLGLPRGLRCRHLPRNKLSNIATPVHWKKRRRSRGRAFLRSYHRLPRKSIPGQILLNLRDNLVTYGRGSCIVGRWGVPT